MTRTFIAHSTRSAATSLLVQHALNQLRQMSAQAEQLLQATRRRDTPKLPAAALFLILPQSAARGGFGPSWTAAETRQLKRGVALGESIEQLQARLPGRSASSINTRAQRLGLLKSRHWTDAELAIVRERTLAGDGPTRILKQLPGRSLSGFYQARARLGLDNPRKVFGPELNEFIRAKNAEQWCDTEILNEWNRLHAGQPDLQLCREALNKRRRKLGLPSNRFADRLRRRTAEKTKQQLAAAGLPSLAALHRTVVKNRIKAMGWPEDLRYREAQILTLIWDRGPLTKKEICEALGMPFRGARGTLKANEPGGTYLATLMRKGLLISFPRAVKTGRKGGNVTLYSLSLNIQRLKTGDANANEGAFAGGLAAATGPAAGSPAADPAQCGDDALHAAGRIDRQEGGQEEPARRAG